MIFRIFPASGSAALRDVHRTEKNKKDKILFIFDDSVTIVVNRHKNNRIRMNRHNNKIYKKGKIVQDHRKSSAEMTFWKMEDQLFSASP